MGSGFGAWGGPVDVLNILSMNFLVERGAYVFEQIVEGNAFVSRKSPY